jgi:peptidoglycan/LPS O-acetylase OafA/YrhL
VKLDAPGHGVRRPEIDGLRGLSALLVIAFHIWFSGVSGGVDILFVVSGYFLMRGILRDPDDPRIRPAVIWAGFAKRLFPQLIVFLLAATIVIFTLVDPANRSAELRHVAFSAIFAENYHLIWPRVQPPAGAAHQAMVEHLWALSVVGQIYLLAPCVLAIMEALRRR